MRLIVHRQNSYSTGNDKGYVTPVAYENDDSTITPVSKDDFPNNQRIWISRGFNKVEEEFGSHELFYLNYWHDTCEKKDNTYEEEQRIENELIDIRTNPNLCRYFSLGSNVSRIDANFMPLVQLPCLPDVASGRMPNQVITKLPSVGMPFFILVEDLVYGPFQIRRESINGNQDDIIFETVSKITPLGLQNNYIAKFKFSELADKQILLRVSTLNMNEMYITNLHAVSASISFEVMDFISDSNLINYFLRDFGKESSITKSNASQLRAAIETSARKGAIAKSIQPRLDRLYQVIDQFLMKDNQEFELIKHYLNSKDGQLFLNKFLQEHQNVIIQDKIKEIADKNTKEINELRQSHDAKITQMTQDFNHKKQEVESKISQIKKDLEVELNSAEKERSKIDSYVLIEEKSGELNELQQKIDNARKELNLLDRAVNIQNQIYKLDGKKENVEEEYKKKESQLKDLEKSIVHQARLLQDPMMLMEKAVETTTLRGIMSGTPFITQDEQFTLAPLTKAQINLLGETRSSYINSLQSQINNKLERQLSYSETANLLVSVMQSYLTIFNGMPGIGKTSTVNNFADALQITAPSNRGNFLSVAVARGWTSSKDLLGNKNAIRQSYEEGRTGIYSLLKALERAKNDSEQEIINHKLLTLILLDEANLSPMEHYWSDFLSICDSFQENKTINLGGRDSKFTLEIPPSLRFIATINSDSTVEPLSDRLLDRASVITLGYEENGSTASEIMQNEIFGGAVPYAELAEAFMVDTNKLNVVIADGKLNSDSNIYNEIVNALRKEMPNTPSIYISPRKLKAIFSYCAIANELSYQQTSPIDFAVAQHILPKIKGHGRGFRERLTELDNILGNSRLIQSKRLLKQIMDNGSEYADTYSLL